MRLDGRKLIMKNKITCILIIIACCVLGVGCNKTSPKSSDGGENQPPVVDKDAYYKVTLDLDGGLIENNRTTYEVKASKTIELLTPTKEEYIFLGWYMGSEEYNNQPINSDTIIKAHWLKAGVIHFITYNSDEGILPEESRNSYLTGMTYQLPIPTKKYNQFEGWYLNSQFEGEVITEITPTTSGNLDIYAKWTDLAVYRNINYYLDGGTLPSDAHDRYVEGETLKLPVPKKEFFFFRGYYSNQEMTGEPLFEIDPAMTGDLKLYAKFVEAVASNAYVSILGDSISTFTGTMPKEYPSYYPVSDVLTVEDMWWHIALSAFDATLLVNNSSSGSKVTSGDFYANSYERIANLSVDGIRPDIVIIYMGINDSSRGVSTTVFERGYRQMLDKIRECYDDVDIWICNLPSNKYYGPTYLNSRLAYNNVLKKIGEDYHYIYLDLAKVITEDNKDEYMYAGPHPNAAGMQIIAKVVIASLRKYYTF